MQTGTRAKMKTLCVAVFVLGFTSLCQSAPLACEQLQKPADKSPDISGSFYLIALSTDSCLLTTLLSSLFVISTQMDIVPKDTKNIYDVNYKFNVYGYCTNDSESYIFEKNAVFEIDANNSPTGKPIKLLQTGCPDCIVVTSDDDVNSVLLYSKRKIITDAEMKEFEVQAKCLGMWKPFVLDSNHDYGNCTSIDDDDTDVDYQRLITLMSEKLKATYTEPFTCLLNILSYPKTTYEWIQQFL